MHWAGCDAPTSRRRTAFPIFASRWNSRRWTRPISSSLNVRRILPTLRRFYRVDPGRVRIVPCGFDPGEFSPLPRRRSRELLGMPVNEFSVLQLGRMVPRKGVDTVAQSIAALQGRFGIQAVLYVVGGNSREPHAAATPEIGRLSLLADRQSGV